MFRWIRIRATVQCIEVAIMTSRTRYLDEQERRWLLRCAHLAAVVFSVAGCSQSFPVRGTFDAVAIGTVQSATGAPVAGAEVAIAIYPLPCTSSSTVQSGVVGATSSTGSFAIRIQSTSVHGDACASVVVRPRSGSGLRDTTIVGQQIRLQTPGTGVILDTLRVDVTLSTN
jgi:hypothetical protein